MKRDRKEYHKKYYNDVARERRGHNKHKILIRTGLSKTNPLYSKTRHALMRRMALEMIQGSKNLKCVICGCTEYELLEINHINGGGRQELISLKGENLYALIIRGRRKTNDLDIRCKMCNILHFIGLKYGSKVAKRYKLKWN